MLLILLLIISCRKNVEPPQEEVPPKPNYIRFDSMAVGQRSRYVFFEHGSDFAASPTYLPDTLVLDIAGQEGTEFLIKEYLTPGSASVKGIATHPWPLRADSVFTYWLRVEESELRLRRPYNRPWNVGSRLFVTPNQYWPLKYFFNTQLKMGGWAPLITYDFLTTSGHFKKGYTTDCVIFGRQFDHLNFIYDDTQGPTDGPSFHFLYAKKYGIVRWTNSSFWDWTGAGWDLLPD